jgi:hypothetical protein
LIVFLTYYAFAFLFALLISCFLDAHFSAVQKLTLEHWKNCSLTSFWTWNLCSFDIIENLWHGRLLATACHEASPQFHQ